MDAVDIVRIIFGSIFVLFIPGLAWSYVFFQKKQIDIIERLALSFGLSIALVPLTVFWFNWIFDIKLSLVNTIFIVLGITAAALVWLFARRRMWTARMAQGLRLRFKFHRSKSE